MRMCVYVAPVRLVFARGRIRCHACTAEDVQNRAVEELQQFRGRLRALNLNVEQLTNAEVGSYPSLPCHMHLQPVLPVFSHACLLPAPRA